MPTRPHIPAEIEREILIESGHRCAVCGTACPLERAHIIPWHKVKTHNAEDMICLCANCHERADNEAWGEKVLREYKIKPWIARNFENKVNIKERKTKVQLSIDMEFNEFDQKWALWIRYGLAAFLDISPENVTIESTEEGSTKLNIALPDEATKRLFNVFLEDQEELARFFWPLKLKHIKFIEAKAIDSEKRKTQISAVDAAMGKINQWKMEGATIVFTNGCFDLLHPGHIKLLQQARTLGDRLIVGLNSDASVKRLKGHSRPILAEQDRVALLSALECVDLVIIFSEDTPIKLIKAIQPDLLVKGADYTVNSVVGREIVESYGGQVKLVEIFHEYSTNILAKKMKQV